MMMIVTILHFWGGFLVLEAEGVEDNPSHDDLRWDFGAAEAGSGVYRRKP